jgi:hypothetical protein
MRWGAAPLLSILLLVVLAAPRNGAPVADAIDIGSVIWEFSEDYPGGEGYVGTFADDGDLPAQTVYLKTHDGVNWMSAWDENPGAINGVERLADWIAYYNHRGIDVVAWFVPRGGDIESQLALARAVIDSGVKGLYADIEPFPGFCDMDCAWLAQTFWPRLRAERPAAQLGVIYDPRPWWWAPSGLDLWMAHANVALPMCYWDTLVDQPPWNDPAGCVFAAKSDLGVVAPGRTLDYVPMLQGDSVPDKVITAVHAAEAVGSTSVSLWRRGVVPPESWNALLAAFPRPTPVPTPPPTPVPPCVDEGCVNQLPDGSKHVVYGGVRFVVDDELASLTGSLPPREITPEALATVPAAFPEDTLLREAGRRQLYRIYGGALMPVTPEHDDGSARVVPGAALRQLPGIPRDGTILQESGKRTTYLVAAGARFPIDAELLPMLGLRADSMRYVCRGGLGRLADIPPGGTALQQTAADSVRTFIRAGISEGGNPDVGRLFNLLHGLAYHGKPAGEISGLPHCAPGIDAGAVP